ncbi:hypothetical protein VUR80DRAFT_7052 [Thermomyces stellatus]
MRSPTNSALHGKTVAGLEAPEISPHATPPSPSSAYSISIPPLISISRYYLDMRFLPVPQGTVRTAYPHTTTQPKRSFPLQLPQLMLADFCTPPWRRTLAYLNISSPKHAQPDRGPR